MVRSQFIIAFVFVYSYTLKSQDNFETIFGEDYNDAMHFVIQNQKEALQIFNYDTSETKIAFAIVFPELIRYSMVRDFFETSALEIFYVENGKDAADFSIGPFQMKPSFIEKLEELSIKNQKETNQKICFNSILTAKQKRTERVKRLKTLKWQVIYLKAFIRLYSAKESIEQLPIQKQVAYLAHAYNHGINTQTRERDLNTLFNTSKYFPYGSKYPGKQYSYAAIAYYFYKNHSI